jgi:hypothetical protein
MRACLFPIDPESFRESGHMGGHGRADTATGAHKDLLEIDTGGTLAVGSGYENMGIRTFRVVKGIKRTSYPFKAERPLVLIDI